MTTTSVPVVDKSTIALGGRHRAVVGQGGHRGAIVAAVDVGPYRRRALKEYLHPRCVPPNELSFIETAVAARDESAEAFVDGAVVQSVEDLRNDAFNLARWHYEFSLASHLVVPDALVKDSDGVHRGIVMPMLSTNLHDFIVDTMPVTGERLESPTTFASFRYTKRFEPIRDASVITSILFQVVAAVGTLQTRLPHALPSTPTASSSSATADDASLQQHCTGYSHNDLHLANLLLHYDTGAIVLCDFELVQHNPPPPSGIYHHPIAERAPPLHRHPPFGLGLAASDVWGVGLLAVDLLTGILPIIDEGVAKDDFGDGPLLLVPEDAYGASVIDWEANMGEHVQRCRGVLAGTCDETDRLYAFCKSCLSNREGPADDDTYEDVAALLEHPLFAPLRSSASDIAGTPAASISCIAPLKSLTSSLELAGGTADDASRSAGDNRRTLHGKMMCLAQMKVREFISAYVNTRPVDRTQTMYRTSSTSSMESGSIT